MADDKAKGKTSLAELTIEIIRPTWKRQMSLKSWTKGSDLAMILVVSPAKDKGIVYLKRGKEVWNWIPAIERNIKLPPSMMSQSWMGTDFTNDDLVKEASIVEDYTHSFSGDSMIDGRKCSRIIMIPKPGAAVVWGKVVLYIDPKDLLMLHAVYYDEDGNTVNTLHCSDIRLLGGKLLPATMQMTPFDKKGNTTILRYHTLQFDKPLDDQFFSTQQMPRLQ